MPAALLPPTPPLVLAAVLALAGCTSPTPPVNASPEPQKRTGTTSNIRQVAVPYGTVLPCDDVLSAGALSQHLGRDVAIEASDVLDRDATAKCWLTGQPGVDQQTSRSGSRSVRRKDRRPERLCHATVYCSFIYDEQTQREKCSAAEGTTSLALGATACRYESPPRVDLLDDDSQCRVVVHPASADIDVATLTSCAMAVATEITPARLRRDPSAMAHATH